jgi:2-methylcitrate dehydratase PrpD
MGKSLHAGKAATDGLLSGFLARDGFKPYACGSLTHPPAQALLEMRSEHGLTACDVASIDAYAHDYVKTTTGLAEPRTGLEGKFSMYHVLAVAFADGATSPTTWARPTTR